MPGYAKIFGRLASGAPLEDVLNILVLATQEVHPGLRASFILINHTSQNIRLVSAPDLSEQFSLLHDGVAIDSEIVRPLQHVLEGKRLIIEDVNQLPADCPQRQLFIDDGIAACWSEPVMNSRRQVLGILTLYFTDSGQIEDVDEPFMQSATNMAAAAIERQHAPAQDKDPARLFETLVLERVAELLNCNINELHLRSQFKQLLANLATHFIKLPASSIDEGVQQALQAIGEFYDMDHAMVLQLKQNGTSMSASHEWFAAHTSSHLELHRDMDLNRFAWGIERWREKRCIDCDDANLLPAGAENEKQHMQSLDVRSFAFIPMRYGHKIKGFVSLTKEKFVHHWLQEDIALLSIAGDMLINALQRKHYEEIFQNIEENLREVNSILAREAREDGLTCIANRRYFDDKLNTEYRRAQREDSPLSLLICDIDFFKNYNDAYGHLLGDDCLIAIANTLRSSFQRAADLPARYGGEEFAIILPNTDGNEALQLAERLRHDIETLEISHRDSSVSEFVTISIGSATLPADSCHELKDLLVTADDALYEAKHDGRNRVCQGFLDN